MKKKQKNPNPRWKDDILDPGFTALPNALIDHQGELGITDIELLFILKVSRNSPDWRIHDNDIPGNQGTRTLQRIRRSLRSKGYLDFTIVRHYNGDRRYYTAGIIYNLDGLANKLRELATRIAPTGAPSGQGMKNGVQPEQNLPDLVTNFVRTEPPESAQPYTNPLTLTSYTNTPYIIIICDNNNRKIKVKLSEEQGLFLEEFKDKYKETYGTEFHPQMKDVKVLQKQNLKELLENVYLLPYWFSWKEDLFQMNEWLKKSDGSLPVFFKPDINHKFRAEFIPRVWHDRHEDSTIKELFGKHMENFVKFKRRA